MPIRTLLRDQDERVDKRVEEAMNRMTEAIKDFRVDAEKSAERMKVEAEKSAERMRMEAEKSAERMRMEAEKSAERMRMEAEKSAELMRMEFREFKVEAEKSAERMRMEAEKSIDAKSENLYLRLVVTLSGASLLLGPMILAGYELISGRILFRGSR